MEKVVLTCRSSAELIPVTEWNNVRGGFKTERRKINSFCLTISEHILWNDSLDRKSKLGGFLASLIGTSISFFKISKSSKKNSFLYGEIMVVHKM